MIFSSTKKKYWGGGGVAQGQGVQHSSSSDEYVPDGWNETH